MNVHPLKTTAARAQKVSINKEFIYDYCKSKTMKDGDDNLYSIDEVVELYREATKDSDDFISVTTWCKDAGITRIK